VSMAKWKLMLTTLPLVAGMILAKYVLERVGYAGIVDFADISAVFTLIAFLIGFMLAGVLADFKESEKIPAEIAAQLETIETALAVAARKFPALDEKSLRTRVLGITTTILDFLLEKAPVGTPLAAISALDLMILEIDKAGAASFATRVTAELNGVRKAVLRVDVISRTSFIQAGYALLDVMLIATMILLLASRFKNAQAEYVLVGFISLIYLYMVRLIRDIDDPFEVGGGGAEVDLFPLHEYRARIESRLSA